MEIDTETSGQRNGPCTISGCPNFGRLLAKLGDIDLIYCPKHRKYGQEVIKTFLSDIFNYKKSKLFDLAKQELLFGGERVLDEKNEERLGSWFRKEIFQIYLRDIGSTSIRLETGEEDFGEEPEILGSPIQDFVGEVKIITTDN